LKVHFGGHSVDLPSVVREMSEFVKEDGTIASASGRARRFISALQSFEGAWAQEFE
jgi:hypothetical protein